MVQTTYSSKKTGTSREHSRILFPFTMRTETGDEVSTQEEDDDYDEIEAFESQLSLSSSTHEDLKPVSIENGSSDQFFFIMTTKKSDKSD